jgi:hypothetical protein
MWELSKATPGGDWVEDGVFDSVQAAARRIQQLEDYQARGVFFRVLSQLDFGCDEETFSYLVHTGRRRSYVVMRKVH